MIKCHAFSISSSVCVCPLGAGCRALPRLCQPRSTPAGPMVWTLVVHGGAGSARDEIESPERMAVLRAAVAAGQGCLRGGGSALDAVQLAVEQMESSPLFNAGRGSAFHALGGHEMDAAMMDGDRRCGAVAGLRTTRHPIHAARHVLENSEHVFFSAGGAERMAREGGVAQAPERYFATGLRREQLQRELAEQREQIVRSVDTRSNGTVGAVALDTSGSVAAATSTGGMTAKPPGRIGDTPVIGAGTFASNDTCAISGTGNGELFLAHAVSATIAAFVSQVKVMPCGYEP
jgi:beta-aspartyl-peptidase (threonine type)